MKKKPLVLFLIGGSGARFLRSFLYYLASGLQLKNIDVIKIVIIDTDEANGNYELSLSLLKLYRKIRAKIQLENDSFFIKDKCMLFYHDINFIDENVEFITPLDTQNQDLSSLIDYVHLQSEQQDFVKLLLTQNELSENLSVGFRGRPNMGTIGLQAIDKAINNSQKLKNLLGDSPRLTEEGLEDSVFFTVSSMFGGMGASGMPLLVNKFSNIAYNNIPIASLSYMYYFKINQGRDTNDSKYFPQRTNLAYEYYRTNFSDKINTLYNIGKSFEGENGVAFSPGKIEQKNNAHYIEFFSVTSLIHFCNNLNVPSFPRSMTSYALHITDNLYANAAGKEYSNIFENYIILILIAKYFTERFEKNYSKDEMMNISWVKFADFDNFNTEEKEILKDFFTGLLKFDKEELYNYSGLRMINSKDFPSNISTMVPHKKYRKYNRGLFYKRLTFGTFAEIDMKGIVDNHSIQSRGNITRLLVLLNKSFTKIFDNIFY